MFLGIVRLWLRLDPRYAAAYYYRGVAKHVGGQLDAAIADFNRALKINPLYAEAFDNRGAERQDKGNLNGAIAHLAVRLDPDYA